METLYESLPAKIDLETLTQELKVADANVLGVGYRQAGELIQERRKPRVWTAKEASTPPSWVKGDIVEGDPYYDAKGNGQMVRETTTVQNSAAIVVFHDSNIAVQTVGTAIANHSPAKTDEQKADEEDPIKGILARLDKLEGR